MIISLLGCSRGTIAKMNIDYDSLFCFVDDFYKVFEPWYKKSLISSGTKR